MKKIIEKAKLMLFGTYLIAFILVIIPIVLWAILGEFHPFLDDPFYFFWDKIIIVVGVMIIVINLFLLYISQKNYTNVLVLVLGVIYGALYIWLSTYVFLGIILMIPLVLICYENNKYSSSQ